MKSPDVTGGTSTGPRGVSGRCRGLLVPSFTDSLLL